MKKFLGRPDEFKQAIETLGQRGSWEDVEIGPRFKTIDGGTIQWYPSTGTVDRQHKVDISVTKQSYT